MRPFHRFRLWARRAPVGERVTAALGAALAVAALAYVVIPPSGPRAVTTTAIGSAGNTTATTAAGSQSGANGSSAAVGGAAAPGTGAPSPSTGSGASTQRAGAAGGATPAAAGTGSSSGSGSGTATQAAHGGCISPPGTDQGVSRSQIKVVIVLVDIAGPAANNVFGIPSSAQQQQIFNAVIGSMNAQGGIACRQIVPIYMQGNPADPSQLQQTCLSAVQAGVFAVLDPGSYSQTTPICFAQNQLPYFGGNMITAQQGAQGYPYLFDLGQYDRLYKDTVFGFQARGEFSAAHGFRKLGIYYHDCHPELLTEELGWLHQAGVPASQIMTYDFGCPTAFANPSDVEQAVLKFQAAGVTDVTYVNALGDFQEFTTIAQQQGFRPQYLLPDDELLGIAYGTERPDSANIANALAITPGRNGEERTPGMTPTAGTKACDAMMEAHGLPPTYQQEQVAGDACNELWMLKAAVEHAPVLQRNALAAGLQAARSIVFSYPQGPDDFSGYHVTTAGQFWRVDQFFESCACWRVIDPTFHPSY